MTAADLDRITSEIAEHQQKHPDFRFVPTEIEAATIETVLQLIQLARKGLRGPHVAAKGSIHT